MCNKTIYVTNGVINCPEETREVLQDLYIYREKVREKVGVGVSPTSLGAVSKA
jgi:hypothetical protein